MNKRKLLGVNIDHVATLRQVRGTSYPEPLQAAYIVQNAGADLLTVHPREDQRHIQKRDVYLIREACSLPLNMEMALYDDIMNMALDLCPDEVCIVPENRNELTTEGGLDLQLAAQKLESFIPKAQDRNIKVSLFIECNQNNILMAEKLGADMVEFHTGTYADAHLSEQMNILNKLKEFAEYADSLDIKVNAGHGLHYENTRPIATIPQINTLNIGHSIISRAVFVGLEQAVRDMIKIIS
ncbi:MAG: pyridoxine 5'-phosphate synthase [Brevinemataceae bacterium]